MTSSAPILELFPRSGEWTEADYFPLSDRGCLIELSDGELEVLPWPTDFHQLILAEAESRRSLFSPPVLLTLQAHPALESLPAFRLTPYWNLTSTSSSILDWNVPVVIDRADV